MNEQSGTQTGAPTGAGSRQGPPNGPQPGPRYHYGPRVSGEQMRDVNRLRRSSSDRYIAGVAGGLGRHFDIDPTVIRVLLAVLTFFGGAGVLIYGVVWLFVPDDRDEKAPVDLNADVLKIVLVVTGAIALMIVFGTPFFGDNWGFAFPLPIVLIGLVLLAIFATRDQRRRADPVPPPPWGSAPPAAPGASAPTPGPQEGTTMSTTDPRIDPSGSPDYQPGHETGYQGSQQPPAWMPPPPPAYVPPPRPRRTGIVLFWPTLALIAIGLGTLGVVDVNTDILVSAYAALAVAIVAAMLLLGAFVARPGGLIALGLVATFALAVTSGVDAATEGDTRGETLRATPSSALLVQDSYRIPNGELTLDLSNVRNLEALDGRTIDARLNAGELVVVLPRGLNAIVDAEMHVVGDIDLDGTHRSGFDQSLTRTVTGSVEPDAPTITLHLDARVGQITVDQD